MDFRTADTGAREEGEGLVGDGSRPREARGKHHCISFDSSEVGSTFEL